MQFPFGNGEAFLEAEINILASTFRNIDIIPLNFGGDERKLPKNVNVINLSEIEGTARGALSYFFKAKMKLSFLMDIRYQWQNFKQIMVKSDMLFNFLKNKEGVHYSYWMDEWATILSLVKNRGRIDGFISRAHGFDLYEERAKLGYRPWRQFVLGNITKVYTVSRMGAEYLNELYPNHKKKFTHSYLGSADYGRSNLVNNESFHLVSCSNVIPLKRVDRIVKALAITKAKIQWTHIGTGGEIVAVKKLAENLPPNVTHEFLGSISHDEVMNHYKNNTVDCFINVSTTEGLPVSMMEAISFGIPILATDVGGVREIVTNQTGTLLAADFTDELLALEIENLVGRKASFSKDEIREFWSKNFSAKENYKVFGENIRG